MVMLLCNLYIFVWIQHFRGGPFSTFSRLDKNFSRSHYEIFSFITQSTLYNIIKVFSFLLLYGFVDRNRKCIIMANIFYYWSVLLAGQYGTVFRLYFAKSRDPTHMTSSHDLYKLYKSKFCSVANIVCTGWIG